MTAVICLLKRKGGTEIDNLFGKNYYFKPESGDGTDPKIPHVCEIPDSDAQALYRLLSIKPTAYVLEDPDADLPPRPKAERGQTIGNETKPKVEIKPVIITDGEGVEINLTELSPEDLRAVAKDTFGIKVHHKWPDQTVIAKIVEKTRGES